MDTLIKKQFLKVCQDTYHPFEIYDKKAIGFITGQDLSYRHLQIFNILFNFPLDVTPGFLSSTLLISPSIISNDLSILEIKGYLTRERSNEDARKTIILLTDKAVEIVEQYNAYVNRFIAKIRKNTNVLQIPIYMKVLKKLKGMIAENKSVSKLDPNEEISDFNTLFLFELHSLFMQPEIALLESSTPKLELRDAFALTELKLYQDDGGSNIKSFSEHFGFNYQTVMSKLKKFEKDRIITKTDSREYIYSDELENLLSHYIKLRIIIYYETFSHFNDKETEYILMIFRCMKENAEEFILEHS